MSSGVFRPLWWPASRRAFVPSAPAAAAQNLAPDGLANQPAHGAATVAPGAVALAPDGLGNTPAYGAAALGAAIAPDGLANSPAYGAASVGAGAVGLTLAGLGNAPAYGATTVAGQVQTIAPAGLANAPAHGGAFALRGDNNLALAADGSTDSNPKQIVRTADNRVYLVVNEVDAYPFEAGDRLIVYKGDQRGIPTTFTQYIQTAITDIGTVAVALNAADDIEILTTSRGGTLAYRTWDTATDTMGSATTIDTGLETNLGQGDTNAALALDSTGVAHIVYLKSDGTRRRVYYRNNSGGTWSAATDVSSAITFGANEKAWLPNIAIDGSDRQLVTFFVGTFNATADGELYSRVRSSGSFGSTVNISGADNAWIEIDQSGSLLVTTDGRYHVAYVDAATNTNEAIRYAYSDDQGATWTHNNPAPEQKTHNPTLGPGPGSDIRLYGHGTPNGSDHGDNLYYFQGAGGAASWGPWTLWQSGTAFDSSVATRWSYHHHHFDQTLDVAYWDDNYPNLVQYAGWTYEGQLLPDGLGNAPSTGTATITTSGLTLLPQGLGVAPATGTATVTAGAVAVAAQGLGNELDYGTATLTATATIAPAGLGVAPAHGTAALAASYALTPAGLGVVTGTGTATVAGGAVALAATGLGNQPAYGATAVIEGALAVVTNPEATWGDGRAGAWATGELAGAWGGGKRGAWG